MRKVVIMVYYKVNAQMADTYLTSGYTLVRGELLTLKEAQRINAPISKLDLVEVNPRQTYWSFGCRFEMHN